MALNTNNDNGLAQISVPKEIYRAISNASAKTGVNFTYLMEKAAAESSFNPNAKARTSSATGLFQFIESTWLTMVKEHGAKYGLAKYADAIGDDNRVSSGKMRKEILNMRKDPEIASYMAAEFASGNYERLKENVGGNIGSTELYLAHFLGAGGATGFLNAMKKSPNMAAADIFPKEARANRGVFYGAGGQPRSLSQIYAMFDKKFDDGAAVSRNFAANQSVVASPNAVSAQNMLQAQSSVLQPDTDPLARMAHLMSYNGDEGAKSSVLRISSVENTARDTNSWQIFPPSLYGKLALSPAQMMMLSDFNA